MLGRDTVIGLVCLAASLMYLAMARSLPHPALVPIGPAFYPRILFAMTAGLSLLLVVSGLRQRPAPRAEAPRQRLVLATFATFIAYVLVLPVLGYRLGTFLFVGGLQAVIEPPRGRRWALVGVVAFLTVLVTYYVFEVYLSVLLPRGWLTGF